MTYNLTELQMADTVSELALYANSASLGMLFVMLNIVFFVALLIIFLKRNDAGVSIFAASFLSFIVSGILAYGRFVSVYSVLFYVFIMAISGFFVYLSK